MSPNDTASIPWGLYFSGCACAFRVFSVFVTFVYTALVAAIFRVLFLTSCEWESLPALCSEHVQAVLACS